MTSLNTLKLTTTHFLTLKVNIEFLQQKYKLNPCEYSLNLTTYQQNHFQIYFIIDDNLSQVFINMQSI